MRIYYDIHGDEIYQEGWYLQEDHQPMSKATKYKRFDFQSLIYMDCNDDAIVLGTDANKVRVWKKSHPALKGFAPHPVDIDSEGVEYGIFETNPKVKSRMTNSDLLYSVLHVSLSSSHLAVLGLMAEDTDTESRKSYDDSYASKDSQQIDESHLNHFEHSQIFLCGANNEMIGIEAEEENKGYSGDKNVDHPLRKP
jgi:alpha-tubulin suppressor-like RCC1 family protein